MCEVKLFLFNCIAFLVCIVKCFFILPSKQCQKILSMNEKFVYMYFSFVYKWWTFRNPMMENFRALSCAILYPAPSGFPFKTGVAIYLSQQLLDQWESRKSKVFSYYFKLGLKYWFLLLRRVSFLIRAQISWKQCQNSIRSKLQRVLVKNKSPWDFLN